MNGQSPASHTGVCQSDFIKPRMTWAYTVPEDLIIGSSQVNNALRNSVIVSDAWRQNCPELLS